MSKDKDLLLHNGHKGPIAWMAGNSVAANLIMIILLAGGLFIGLHIKQEVFPEFSLDIVNISVAYPGASPEEVEQGIILAIEEVVRDLEGVEELSSTAKEGLASVSVDAQEGADISRLLQDIKTEVDRIGTFPEGAHDPQITIASRKLQVMSFALYGDTSEITLRDLANQVRDELLMDEGITQVELGGIRDREIQIEIPEINLRRYGLTLQDVAQALSRASVETGSGTIRTGSGDIFLRVSDRKDYARQYAGLPIIVQEDGSTITLGDIGVVSEGFEDTDSWGSFNGKRAVVLTVYRVGKQTPNSVSKAATASVQKMQASLPPGIKLELLRDLSKIFRQRADLLLRNAYVGLGLVFLFLALFLEIRLAFWVAMGIPISFLGSFIFLSATEFSINMVTMFAFIVTLGIVVDDAIVVGENIYYHRRQGLKFLDAAIKGAREMFMPVFFSVTTNMVAFVPLMFVPGIMGKIFKTIPVVVITVFAVSLIESLFVLPAHLGNSSQRPLFFPLNYLAKFQEKFSSLFEKFIKNYYGGFLSLLLKNRYSVITFGLALLMTVAGYLYSGRMGMEMFPKVESDYAFCEVTLPYGASSEASKKVERILVKSAAEIVKENGGEELGTGIFSNVVANTVQVRTYLTDAEIRPVNTTELTNKWRKKVGLIPGVETLNFLADRGGPGSGKSLTVSLSHMHNEILTRAGEDLTQSLSTYSIISDIDSGSAKGKKQFDIVLSSAGKRMGLTSREVAIQVRNAFQGVEAVKYQRGRDEVTVRVRLPKSERDSEFTFENLMLRAPGGEILLRNAVETIIGRAYTSIKRVNGKREIAVTANVRPQSRAPDIIRDMKTEILPDLMGKYPGLSYSFRGRQANIQDSVSALMKGLALALLCIFALMAIPFRSYIQPLIIMFCIPFGIIGVVVGHIIMGYSLSVMSLFGLVALCGVVVNSSLVMIVFANEQRRQGANPASAIHAAGIQRFRPIVLTTLTTCGGLTPIIMETSRQAKFLIPMAISLGYGILFSTLVSLMMVPCLYLIIEDIKKLFSGDRSSEINYDLAISDYDGAMER